MDDMINHDYNTPARKMSLRRKRSIKADGIGESPVHKKTSPSSTRNAANPLPSSSSNALKTEHYTAAKTERYANAKTQPYANVKTQPYANVKTQPYTNVKTQRYAAVKAERSPVGDSSNEENLSQVYHTRRSSSLQASVTMTGYTTPKHLKKSSKSAEKKSDAKRAKELEEQRRHQHSPDTPFMSSQLCGTQECEVVWDCNSPGFSKDDLKRMAGHVESDEIPSPTIPVFVAPIPHRALFPKTRSRSANNASTVNTTAQLDELLSQLTAKGSLTSGNKNGLPAPSSTESQGPSKGSTITQTLLIPHSPPADKDSQPASPPIPPDFVKNIPSQPFEVWEGNGGSGGGAASDNPADVGMLEETAWDDDLNTAICDLSDGDEVSGTPSKPSKMAVDGCGPSAAQDKTDKTNDSVDIFDDDYFNDTLIESTQIWENQIMEKGAENSTIATNNVFVKASEVGHKVQNQSSGSKPNHSSFSLTSVKPKLNEIVSENSSEGKYGKKAIFSHGAKACNKVDNTRDVSISDSPVMGKAHASRIATENPPQRRVRNSFRLNAHQDTDLTSQKTIQSSRNIDTFRNSKVNTSHLGAVSKDTCDGNINKKSDKLETSRFLSDKLRKDPIPVSSLPLPKNHSLEPELPKLQPRKALFVGGAGSKSSEKLDGRAENFRSSFSRSQSTGNAQVTDAKVTTMSRPTKSEDAEGSREFEEDDSFFESLLCTLPEDEMIVGAFKGSEVPLLRENKTTILSKGSVVSSKNECTSTMSNISKSKIVSTVSDLGIKDRSIGQKMATVNNVNNISRVTNFNQGNAEVKSSFSPVKQRIPSTSEKSLSAGMSSLRSISETNQRSNLPLKSSDVPPVKQELHKSLAGDILDDDLFEDDVLSLIDEVESQFGSQPLPSVVTGSQPSQLSLSQQSRCTSDEIARKKEEARRRREERQRKEEAQRRREEEQKADEMVKQEEEAQRVTQERRKAEEIARKREEAQRRREEKQRADEARKKEEAQRQREEKQKMDEIARKKEEALRRREERQRSRQQHYYPPLC